MLLVQSLLAWPAPPTHVCTSPRQLCAMPCHGALRCATARPLPPPRPKQVVLWAHHALRDHFPLASHMWMAAQLAPLLAALALMALRPATYLQWRMVIVFTGRMYTYLAPNSRTLNGAPQVLQRAAAPSGLVADGYRILLGGSPGLGQGDASGTECSLPQAGLSHFFLLGRPWLSASRTLAMRTALGEVLRMPTPRPLLQARGCCWCSWLASCSRCHQPCCWWFS